jgi:hypothetical protein
MSICYAISTGEYSDYQVCAIFTTREKAEAAKDAYGADAEIEEFRLDPVIPERSAGRRLYHCSKCSVSGQVYAHSANLSDLSFYNSLTLDYASYFEPHPRGKSSQVYVFARDPEHAVKIAAEKFAKAEAIQAGIA